MSVPSGCSDTGELRMLSHPSDMRRAMCNEINNNQDKIAPYIRPQCQNGRSHGKPSLTKHSNTGMQVSLESSLMSLKLPRTFTEMSWTFRRNFSAPTRSRSLNFLWKNSRICFDYASSQLWLLHWPFYAAQASPRSSYVRHHRPPIPNAVSPPNNRQECRPIVSQNSCPRVHLSAPAI